MVAKQTLMRITLILTKIFKNAHMLRLFVTTKDKYIIKSLNCYLIEKSFFLTRPFVWPALKEPHKFEKHKRINHI